VVQLVPCGQLEACPGDAAHRAACWERPGAAAGLLLALLRAVAVTAASDRDADWIAKAVQQAVRQAAAEDQVVCLLRINGQQRAAAGREEGG
jgi:hypothetical protein